MVIVGCRRLAVNLSRESRVEELPTVGILPLDFPVRLPNSSTVRRLNFSTLCFHRHSRFVCKNSSREVCGRGSNSDKPSASCRLTSRFGFATRASGSPPAGQPRCWPHSRIPDTSRDACGVNKLEFCVYCAHCTINSELVLEFVLSSFQNSIVCFH